MQVSTDSPATCVPLAETLPHTLQHAKDAKAMFGLSEAGRAGRSSFNDQR